MQELLIYLLKTSGLMTAFFLAYHLLLRKETFFTGNRWFLLSGLVASALLPLFFIKKIVYVEHPKLSIADLIALSKNTNPISASNIAPQVESIDWFEIACYGYGVVVLLLLLKVCITLFSIIKIVKNKAIQKENGFSLIDLNKDITPFSFFNYIVFNSSLYATEELENILLHEKVHCQQRHSIDVLVAHLFAIVFWINPIVWFYKKAIIQNLEFIADHNAIQQIEDKKAYQKVLLKVVSHQNCLPITNHFYQSLIKKRIVMLNKNQSHRRNSWKYTVVLPALIAFVFLFQIKVEAQEKEVRDVLKEFRESDDVSIALASNDPDDGWYSIKNEFKNKGIIIQVSNIKRNSDNKIISINIVMKSDDERKKELNIDRTIPIKAIKLYVKKVNNEWDFGAKEIESIDHPDDYTNIPYEKIISNTNRTTEKTIKSNNLTFIIDAITSDKDLNSIVSELKEMDITLSISNLKRDRNNEIIAVKLDFKDKKGHKGSTQQEREIPIRPIFFKISDEKNGFDKIGFYNNSELINKPYDKILNNKISAIETISEDAVIFVDDEKYSKQALETLDPNHLISITILNDSKSLEKYGVKDKKEVIIIKTDWKTNKVETVQEKKKVIIFSNDNGDDIVFILSEKILKLPGYPSIRLNDDGLVLIINGIQKSNPLETLNQMDLQTVKSIRVYDENGKITPGTQTKKIIITTK